MSRSRSNRATGPDRGRATQAERNLIRSHWRDLKTDTGNPIIHLLVLRKLLPPPGFRALMDRLSGPEGPELTDAEIDELFPRGSGPAERRAADAS